MGDFGPDFITQRYLRRYPDSKRAKSLARAMVHIQTENGVWRIGGSGYLWAGKPDAWIIAFEDAVRKIDHCGLGEMRSLLTRRRQRSAKNRRSSRDRTRNTLDHAGQGTGPPTSTA